MPKLNRFDAVNSILRSNELSTRLCHSVVDLLEEYDANDKEPTSDGDIVKEAARAVKALTTVLEVLAPDATLRQFLSARHGPLERNAAGPLSREIAVVARLQQRIRRAAETASSRGRPFKDEVLDDLIDALADLLEATTGDPFNYSKGNKLTRVAEKLVRLVQPTMKQEQAITRVKSAIRRRRNLPAVKKGGQPPLN